MREVFLLITGFIVLVKSADFLVEGARILARRLKVSDLAVGLTVVAFGTSLPELSVNIIASLAGNTDIALGNVLGSNTANIFLILGISALIFPLSVQKGTVWKEIPMALAAALFTGIMLNDAWLGRSVSELSRSDGVVLLGFFCVFMYYVYRMAGESKDISIGDALKETGSARISGLILGGLAGLWLGSVWVVDGAVYLAEVMGLSQSFIGLTIVAIGTSLPELATSTVAAYKRNSDIAVGNIVGSNIFNIFFILGLSSIIRPIPLSPGVNTDIGVVVFASLILFFSTFAGKKRLINRREGLVFLFLYVAYFTFLIRRG